MGCAVRHIHRPVVMKAILVLFALLVAVECYYVARPISYDDQPHYATVPLAYQRPPRCPMNNPDCIRKFKDQVKHWKYSKAMDRRCHPQSEISVNYDELRSKVAETTTRLDDTLSELARGPRFSVKIAYTRQVFLAQHAFREHQLALEELLQALFPEAHEVREDQALIIKPNVTVAEQDSHVKMLLTAARMDERAVQRIFRDPKQNFLVIRFVRKELMNEFLHQFRELNLFKLLGGCARLTRDMNADERKKYRKAIQECEVKNKTLPNRSFYVDLVTLQVCEKHEMNPLPRKFER
ncbi:hypothetical protein QR680_014523 [Steinernema hermaphroditum]|uniref:Uncharacterized protein n=1 Tax=Steinernema hermaphroditum TaxID=289476 RepID=A0AA39I951_9BILA|nr:hypothetical protein QR680_014523 [Steinernema hermaphroditum]